MTACINGMTLVGTAVGTRLRQQQRRQEEADSVPVNPRKRRLQHAEVDAERAAKKARQAPAAGKRRQGRPRKDPQASEAAAPSQASTFAIKCMAAVYHSFLPEHNNHWAEAVPARPC